MSDMKVAVRLRWEPGLDMVIYSFRKIFINFLLDKVFGNYFFCFLSRCHILSHINFLHFVFSITCPYILLFSISAVFPFPAGSDIELL